MEFSLLKKVILQTFERHCIFMYAMTMAIDKKSANVDQDKKKYKNNKIS